MAKVILNSEIQDNIVMFSHMKLGQYGVIVEGEVHHDHYVDEVVIRAHGGLVVKLSDGSTWDNLSETTIKVRVLNKDESVTIFNE